MGKVGMFTAVWHDRVLQPLGNTRQASRLGYVISETKTHSQDPSHVAQHQELLAW